MTTIVLHIGLPKNGSSLIQYLLAQRRDELARLGVYYAADHYTTMPRTKITSGNGRELVRYLSPEKRDETFSPEQFEAEFSQRWISESLPVSLISSEHLCVARPDMVRRFQDKVAGGRPIKIIAYIRDIYGHAWSSWMQSIKHHAYSESFEAYCKDKYYNPQFAFVKRFEGFFPESITLLHYESARNDIFKNFMTTMNIEMNSGDEELLINRSLSKCETEVLLECNKRYKNDKSMSVYISNYLIEKYPNRQKWNGWNPDLADYLRSRFADDVKYLNDKYFNGAATLAIARPPASPDHDTSPTAEQVRADVKEALEIREARARRRQRASSKPEPDRWKVLTRLRKKWRQFRSKNV